MRHVVMFSGGVGSWAAAKRVASAHGTGDLTLLFTDTLMEDEDLYRFLDDAAENIGVPVTRIAEGRDPWQVFFDGRFLGNSRIDPCSKSLKRQMIDRWLRDHCEPNHTRVYVGIDWTEIERFEGDPDDVVAAKVAAGKKPRLGLRRRRLADGWTYDAPMCAAPYLSKREMLSLLKAEGVRPPRLYDMGFAHNNCGGFCIKAGRGHFALLLKALPDRYRYHEAKEQEIRALIGADVSMLTDRSGDGRKKPLTLLALRERIEAGAQVDMFDIGGCGCFVDDETSYVLDPSKEPR